MARQDPLAHKRKGASRGLEMFLDWAVVIVCLLVSIFALRSWACNSSRPQAAPRPAAPPALVLRACAPPSNPASPWRRDWGMGESEVFTNLPGATLADAGGYPISGLRFHGPM